MDELPTIEEVFARVMREWSRGELGRHQARLYRTLGLPPDCPGAAFDPIKMADEEDQ